ncbi:hypothetical protein NQ318_005363 [Aromia moschata]|uniref:Uncharacterized protein n=1 Tax=Aromia moschata TaxID=1265417 RepID=A0AAV8YXT9_9CUCU|nr:hypothetical protein NQ318_005363 [Aromia moschata]
MYEVCKLSNETGNAAPDLSILWRRDLEGQFCFRVGHSATDTFAKLQHAYGNSVFLRAHIFQRFKAFSEGRELIQDEPRSGRPSSSRPMKISIEYGIIGPVCYLNKDMETLRLSLFDGTYLDQSLPSDILHPLLSILRSGKPFNVLPLGDLYTAPYDFSIVESSAGSPLLSAGSEPPSLLP